MANPILTPITLWKDFDESLPLNEEIISQTEEDGVVVSEVYFDGRQTAEGRVKIFGRYFAPKGAEEFPVVMVLFEAGLPVDRKFVDWLLSRGYGVFCLDYCGDDGTEHHTVYPSDVSYANYAMAGRRMTHVDETAKETSWYEWAAVARYCVRYLSSRKEVSSVGAIGIRTGGEILWKIAPFSPLSCMIPICAAGWLAYAGVGKFGARSERIFNEERHRFLAGIESQTYAPYCKCPVLLLCAINDKKYNCDRVYDTFQQINADTEKAILFSARGNGLMGEHTLVNLYLFLDKYLKGRSIYLTKPIGVSFDEDEKGNLVAKGNFDPMCEIEECGVFYTEEIDNYKAREWTRVLATEEQVEENGCVCPLDLYAGSSRALVYSFVRYSNGFSATSKIQEFKAKKEYCNTVGKTRVIYSSDDGLNGFIAYRQRAKSVADCFVSEGSGTTKLLPGYGGIMGISCDLGLLSFRVSEERYKAPENVDFQFDAYSQTGGVSRVFFLRNEEGQQVLYACEVKVEKGGRWQKICLRPGEFKSDTGASLTDFSDVSALIFLNEEEILYNNVIWL
ncbi:MAG: hypothetical protein J6C93_02365 [Clostridia bacterium]|nr:hypothetical protein [Clostridia bacterium]